MGAETLEFDGTEYPDGRASDPRGLGWMDGTPPPVDKRITFEGGRFAVFPELRWSVSHMRELGPTANVWRGRGTPSLFEHNGEHADDIAALSFADLDGRPRRFDEALFDTYTDGVVVLHRGRIVYERYFGALEPHLPHACYSMTKSYAGTITATYVQEGVLDDSKRIPHYLPELRATGWRDATLRQVMDMETGLAYTEEYTETQTSDRASVWQYLVATGRRPRPAGYAGPETLCDHLLTVKKEGRHGRAFAYTGVNADVMAWVTARVTGRSFAELLHERLWAPLGCEEDGYVSVDAAGMQTASGGMCATLRDVARFGEMMRREGDWNGKQVIPAAVVRDIRQGGDRGKFARAGFTSGAYRCMWWVTDNEHGAFEARGIHGQRLYVAPKAEMVVARFGSHPVPLSLASNPITIPQLLALGQMLRS
jgi:CubicO group peptidase (beta-lactamase class C family)